MRDVVWVDRFPECCYASRSIYKIPQTTCKHLAVSIVMWIAWTLHKHVHIAYYCITCMDSRIYVARFLQPTAWLKRVEVMLHESPNSQRNVDLHWIDRVSLNHIELNQISGIIRDSQCSLSNNDQIWLSHVTLPLDTLRVRSGDPQLYRQRLGVARKNW